MATKSKFGAYVGDHEIDIDEESLSNEGVGYPIIFWRSGDKKMKRMGGVEFHGGFFITDDVADPDEMEAAGFVRDTFSTDNGDEIDGWSATKLDVQMVVYRRRWRAGDRSFAWSQFNVAKSHDDKVRGQMHIMVRVKGLPDDVGPMILSLSGMSQMSMHGDKDFRQSGVMPRAQTTVVRAANEFSKSQAKAAKTKTKGVKVKAQEWPLLAFYIPMGVPFVGETEDEIVLHDTKDVYADDFDGEPAFITAGSGKDTSNIVVISTVLPNWDDVDIDDFFAFDDVEKATTMFRETGKEWRAAWDIENMNTDAPEQTSDADQNDENVEDEEFEEIDIDM